MKLSIKDKAKISLMCSLIKRLCIQAVKEDRKDILNKFENAVQTLYSELGYGYSLDSNSNADSE